MTDTHCPYCALQCAMTITTGAGQRPAVTPRDFPTNRGGLCQKGWTSATLLDTPDRLTTPLLRDAVTGGHRRATWDEALGYVAAKLRALRAAHGADAVAVFGSGALTNEKSYLLGKFARVALGTSQIDYNGRFCMSSAAAAGNRAFGLDRGLPFPVTDLDAADLIVLAGANPAETMPPLMGHLTGKGTTLIVVDPRRTPTAEAALKSGGLHLQPTPGTDLALALGLLHAAWTSGYLETPERAAYRESRTDGWARVRATLTHWWPERVERLTGVSAADLRRAAHLLHAARRRYVLTGRGAEQHSKGTDTVTAWINLALAFGLPGTPGNGYGCLTGQGNGQGGREHGQKADQLPGYRSITNDADRAHIAKVWGIDAADIPGAGRSATELLDALGTENGPKALLVFGANLVVSAPRSRWVIDRLAALDLLVVADSVPSETAQLADVILPVAQWAEESGTMTNLEGRILRRNKALDPPLGVLTDLEILSGLATRLDRKPTEFPADPDAVLAELREASAGGRADYSGVTEALLATQAPLYWPLPATGYTPPALGAPTLRGGSDIRSSTGPWPGVSSSDEPTVTDGDDIAGEPVGTPRPFLDRFAHADGKARFVPVEHRDAGELTDADYPLIATTGRVLQHYQSGAQTRRVPELAAAQPEAFVEIHPDTAERNGLQDGVLAHIESRRGTVTARVRYVPSLRLDTVFLPFHFSGAGTANALTNPALDPTSRMPEFKFSAVRLAPASPSATPESAA
jgi:assimilatory nitrate reductase catalytic subunit